MKAILHPRIRTEGRTDIAAAIPLDTPLHIFVDVSAACNFKCAFCFDHTKARHDIMKLSLFKKIMQDCRKFPRRLKALRLYGFGEPLLNKNLAGMVWIAKEMNVAECVEFTTNGWWLKPDLNKHLISSGLDAITISVPGVNHYKIHENIGKNINLPAYIENVKDFYNKSRGKCRVHCKMTNYNATEWDIGEFYRLFGDICDEISVDNIVPVWSGPKQAAAVDPTKNIYNIPLEKAGGVEICPYIFYHMTVHANGFVSACFTDWNHQLLIGNANEMSLVDIWNGRVLAELRMEHLSGRKSGLCINCGQLRYGMPDNIDGARNEIIKRLSL